MDTITENTDMKEFVAQRISQLVTEKNISEHKASYDLGLSRGYIQAITSKKIYPSFAHFFEICKYFDITPAEFFDPDFKRNKDGK